MYRIEVAPGEESVFRTIEELAIAIRNGVITPRARIFHQASQKWLPIGLHPHYKKALELPAATAGPPVTAATPMPSTGRPKSHAPVQPSPQVFEPTPRPQPPAPVARAPEPKHFAAPKALAEPMSPPKPSAAPTIRPPMQSPVIAMQSEVLRDLPMLHIPEPEPLPWHTPARAVTATQAPAEARPQPTPPAASAPPAERTVAPPTFEPGPVERRTFEPGHTQRRTFEPQHPPRRTFEPGPVDLRVAESRPAARSVEYRPEPRIAPRKVAASAAYVPLEYTGPVDEPEPAITEDAPAPRPTARRSRRAAGRPVMLLGVAVALVVSTHFVLTSTLPASADAEADAAPAPSAEERPADATGDADALEGGSSAVPAQAAAEPRVSIAPARVRMTPGPAFSGSAPLRSGDTLAATAAARTAPAPAPVPADAGLAPAPTELDLAMPDLPSDSVVPRPRTGDTMGMKKILRALNGVKPVEATAGQ